MKKIKILFGMSHAGFFRNFEDVILQLLAAGVDVHVHFSLEHHSINMSDYALSGINQPGVLSFSTKHAGSRPKMIVLIRLLRDLIHYSKPEFQQAADLRSRFASMQRASKFSAFLQKIFDRLPWSFKNKLDNLLQRMDGKLSPTADADTLVKNINPDYVIVTPYVNFVSKEVDLIKSARNRKIPTLYAVASWDNLTNKGRMMFQTDHVSVWNKPMFDEAVKLHDVQPEKIWITGAPPFDHWFKRSPSRDKNSFCNMLGFDPAKPTILYLCSAEGIAGREEHLIINEWKKCLENSGHSILSNVNILIRPHPLMLKGWNKILPDKRNIESLNGMKIWPLDGKHPTTEQRRADFFDSLYYADAIVGLNTSAMIEAAILNKPILTFLGHQVASSQKDNLHFEHLVKGGFLIQGANLHEHVDQLAKVLHSPSAYTSACQDFIATFVRPLGRDQNASDKLVSHILTACGYVST